MVREATLVTRDALPELQRANRSLLILKLGADWCKPCRAIEPLVTRWFDILDEKATCLVIDVDESFDLYAYLKVKKMVSGIPTILCYDSGTVSYIPDDAVAGSDATGVKEFFERCAKKVGIE